MGKSLFQPNRDSSSSDSLAGTGLLCGLRRAAAPPYMFDPSPRKPPIRSTPTFASSQLQKLSVANRKMAMHTTVTSTTTVETFTSDQPGHETLFISASVVIKKSANLG